MASIYKITNTVNSKVYIGKTEGCIHRRFREHCVESTRKRSEKRPLYNAMRKYGTEVFSTELLCTTTTPEKDEIRLIEEYGSYGGGYNATLGGDGTKYIALDELAIVAEYLAEESITVLYLSKKYSISVDSMRNLLRSNGVTIRVAQMYLAAPVKQYTKAGVLVAVHESANDAGRALGKLNGSHIAACVRGERKTAYGFIWTE